MTNCVVCDKINPLYKCPKCRISYCSIECFKCHQNECKPPEISQNESKADTDYNYVTEDTIPVEKLKLLEGSEKLRTILSNPHVRDILLEIDRNSNAKDMMEKAMKEPIFVEFADACLEIVENKTNKQGN